jgi:hypothetical protein
MKGYWLILLLFICHTSKGQNLQVHYDFRHSVDPGLQDINFPSLSFEYFNENDSAGSFLFKMQTDFNGENSYPGQTFLQVTKNLRYWEPLFSLALSYSGGLGVSPPSFGFYIANSFGVGVAYPFSRKTYLVYSQLGYRYNAFANPSHDLQFTLYYWMGFFNYKLQISGSIISWTQNRNLGTVQTRDLEGKKFVFFGDPQLWFKLSEQLSIGTRLNLFFHLLTDENSLQVYPTIGLKHDF